MLKKRCYFHSNYHCIKTAQAQYYYILYRHYSNPDSLGV